MKKAIAFALLWVACGFYAWGTAMAELDYKNHHEWEILERGPRDNVGLSAFMSAGGPVGAIDVVLLTNFNQHGWMLWGTKVTPEDLHHSTTGDAQ
jgi:hypothetical protein